ncbi:MAG: TetR/AcrR family transcriptional regulator [Bacteroidales bacterium]
MEIKNKIRERASELFFKYGIRSITMDEVADSLGMSKRTLYESFKNKEELLKECIEYQYEKNIAIRDQLMKDYSKDPLEVLFQTFRATVINLNSIHPNFFNDIQKYHSHLWKDHVKSKQEEGIESTSALIENGIAAGIFRKGVDAQILSRLIHASMEQMSTQDIFPETRFPRSEVFQQVFLNFIRGMASKEGLIKIDEKFQL